MSHEADRVLGWSTLVAAQRPGARTGLIAAAALTLLLASASPASAGPPTSCGKDFYGSVWVAGQGWSWPSGVLVPAYDATLSPQPNFRGDDQHPIWYTHGGTKRNQIQAIFQVSGCDYPKHDFTLNLVNSTRQLYATVPDHEVDPWFVNVDRMASVPITTDNQAFRTFCGGSGAMGVVLDSPQVERRSDGYPAWVDGVLMDNYAGCFKDPDDQYYVRRMMAIQSDELNASGASVGTSVFVLGRSPIRDGGSAMDCEPCSFTSFVRVYHPDANTWVVAPEYAPPPTESLPEYPWQAAYQRSLNNNWVFEQYATLPFAMVVKRLQ